MTALKLSKKEFSDLYDELRNCPCSDWNKDDVKRMALRLSVTQEEIKEMVESLKLVSKMAKNTEKGQFLLLVTQGEMPPVKLSTRELALLKGGRALGSLSKGIEAIGGVSQIKQLLKPI